MNERYARPHKYDQLGPAARRLARVPRYARLIAMLPPDRFGLLSSAAATFWEVYNYVAVDPREETGLLDDGLKATEARQFGWHKCGSVDRSELGIRRWQVRLARDLLAAIAFEMFLGQAGSSDTLPMFTVVKDLEGFLNRAFDRFESAGAYQTARNKPIDGEYLWEDWRRLKAMDSHGLKHLVFSATEQRLQFTDITTQTFFAAYWACRWANDDDRWTMRKWLPDPLGDTKEAYAEFWTLVLDMPEDACDPLRYELLLSPLYDGTWQGASGLPIRSTELIYRSWERMKDTSAGKQFRCEFPELRNGTGDPACVVVARELLASGDESHFLSLCEGERGKEDTGRFVMGAPDGEAPDWDGSGEEQNNPLHPVYLTHFRLHRYCITNAAYELFDGRHFAHRKFADEVSNVDRHPVVRVSWYDAWCFAHWVGEIEVRGRRYRVVLPSEAQWEYACRAGLSTPFTWDDVRDGNRIESGYCNFAGDYPWQVAGTRQAAPGPYRECTVQVDGVDEDGTLIAPNRWGFFQLHGNVWEWCQDWYGADYYQHSGDKQAADPLNTAMAGGRVMRGGSWISSGRYCRSGFRLRYSPDFRGRGLGFRLAAVPVESKTGQ